MTPTPDAPGSRGAGNTIREQRWLSTEGKLIYLRVAGRRMIYGPSALLDGRTDNVITLPDGQVEYRRAFGIRTVAVVDGIEMATAYPETTLRCQSCSAYHRRCELLQYYGKYPEVYWIKEDRRCDCRGLIPAAAAAQAEADYRESLEAAEELLATYREGLE